jgi:hypothetical protein
MKREEMVLKIAECLSEPHFPDDVMKQAEAILSRLERAGMRPPQLDEDKCQALMHVYYAGYTFNQWDEEFEKDEKAVAALKLRREIENDPRPLRERLKARREGKK